ncbi:MAG TPA: hypothetical protein DCE41_13020 [Cytophagales bacterium]|nr:hypothetical protein [Cytophagales bacterium]HAP61426.1 hypothetical protein [Cytophagales bacterium]
MQYQAFATFDTSMALPNRTTTLTTQNSSSERTRFLVKNLLRGLLSLVILVVGFVLFKKYVDLDFTAWLQPLYDNPAWVYLIYTISEIMVGIIPPELFFMWALNTGSAVEYAGIVAALAALSYVAGLIGYWVGNRFSRRRFFRIIRVRFIRRYERYFDTFGAFLIIVAALTPLPFSGIAMLVGSVGFNFRKYCLYASIRFVRYAAYSFIIWEANTL